MESHLIGLLLLLQRLQQVGQPLGRETILPFAEIKLPQVARTYDALVLSLQEKNLIEGDPEQFTLCQSGLDLVKELSQRYSLHAWFYNEYYQAILHSQAHALFCERVYGKDLGQHGMADMEQIHLLISQLEIRPGMTTLDFGCGDGQITEYIADVTQATAIGIDIADDAIRLAERRTREKCERMKFQVVDREGKLRTIADQSFDRIWAIDSLFFSPDQAGVMHRLLSLLRPTGRMGIFYICPPDLGSGDTAIAETLSASGISFRVTDLSAQNRTHWQKKKRVLLELEGMFKAEGSEFLFKNRLAECSGLENFHRYLYVVPAA